MFVAAMVSLPLMLNRHALWKCDRMHIIYLCGRMCRGMWVSSFAPLPRQQQVGLRLRSSADSVSPWGRILRARAIGFQQPIQRIAKVLNETSKQLTITMANPNALPVNFQWSFVEEAAARLNS